MSNIVAAPVGAPDVAVAAPVAAPVGAPDAAVAAPVAAPVGAPVAAPVGAPDAAVGAAVAATVAATVAAGVATGAIAKAIAEIAAAAAAARKLTILEVVRTKNAAAFAAQLQVVRSRDSHRHRSDTCDACMTAAAALGATEIATALQAFGFVINNASENLYAVAIDAGQLGFVEYLMPLYSTNHPNDVKIITESLKRNDDVAIRTIHLLDGHACCGLNAACMTFIVEKELIEEMMSLAEKYARATPIPKTFHDFLQIAIRSNKPRISTYILERKLCTLCAKSVRCCLNLLITEQNVAPDWEDNALTILRSAPDLKEGINSAGVLNTALRYHQFKIAAALAEVGFKSTLDYYDSCSSIIHAVTHGNLEALELIERLQFAPILTGCDFMRSLYYVAMFTHPVDVKIRMTEILLRIHPTRSKVQDPQQQQWERNTAILIIEHNEFEFARWLAKTARTISRETFLGCGKCLPPGFLEGVSH